MRVDVEAEQQAAQVLQAARDALGRRDRRRLGGQVQLDGLGGRASVGLGVVAERLQAQQRRAGLHLAAHGDRRTRCSRALNGARSTVSIFMLSSTSTGAPASTSSPTCSGVATTSAGAGERTTPPSSRLTRCVTPSTSTRWIGPCVSVSRRNRRAVDDDLAGVPVEAVELDVGGADVAAGLDADAEPVRADPRDAHAVADAAQLEVQRPAALVLHLRAPAVRGRQQPLPLDALLVLVRLDGGGGQRDARSAGARPAGPRRGPGRSSRCRRWRRSPRAGRAGRARSSCWSRRPR